MYRLGCIALSILISTSISGASQPVLPNEINNYDLLPGQPITLQNIQPNTVILRCEVHFATSTYHVLVKGVKGSSIINGTTINPGQTMTLQVYQMQVIPIIANVGAQTQFTNLSSNILRLACTSK